MRFHRLILILYRLSFLGRIYRNCTRVKRLTSDFLIKLRGITHWHIILRLLAPHLILYMKLMILLWSSIYLILLSRTHTTGVEWLTRHLLIKLRSITHLHIKLRLQTTHFIRCLKLMILKRIFIYLNLLGRIHRSETRLKVLTRHLLIELRRITHRHIKLRLQTTHLIRCIKLMILNRIFILRIVILHQIR